MVPQLITTVERHVKLVQRLATETHFNSCVKLFCQLSLQQNSLKQNILKQNITHLKMSKLLENIRFSQRFSHRYIYLHVIIVRDGNTRCGIFIAAYNMIMMLKNTQEPNLDEIVLNMRCRRKQFVSTFVSKI